MVLGSGVKIYDFVTDLDGSTHVSSPPAGFVWFWLSTTPVLLVLLFHVTSVACLLALAQA